MNPYPGVQTRRSICRGADGAFIRDSGPESQRPGPAPA